MQVKDFVSWLNKTATTKKVMMMMRVLKEVNLMKIVKRELLHPSSTTTMIQVTPVTPAPAAAAADPVTATAIAATSVERRRRNANVRNHQARRTMQAVLPVDRSMLRNPKWEDYENHTMARKPGLVENQNTIGPN